MPRSIEEIKADIAKTEQEIALRDKYRNAFSQPRTPVGWASYVATGDRGLLDAYQNRENQWTSEMQKQDYAINEALKRREFEEEQADIRRKFEEEQAELNRAHAEKLAKEQRAEQASYNIDEYMMRRNQAAVKYNYAEQALAQAKKEGDVLKIATANRDLDLAKHELNYWNNRTGYTAPIEEANSEEPPVPPQNIGVRLSDLKAIKSFKTEAEKTAKLEEIKSDPTYGQNKELQDEYNRLNAIRSAEEVDAALDAANAEFLKTGKYDNTKFKIKYSNKKASLVRK